MATDFLVGPQGIGYGRYAGTDEFAVVFGQSVRVVDAATVEGASSNEWSDVLSDRDLETSDWFIWQFGNRLFFTNPEQGVWYRSIGYFGADSVDEDGLESTQWKALVEDPESPGSTGDASASYLAPTYSNTAEMGGSDTPGGSSTADSETADFENDLLHIRVHGWQGSSETVTMSVAFTTPRDYSVGNVMGIRIRPGTTGGVKNTGAQVKLDDGTVEATIPAVVQGQNKVGNVGYLFVPLFGAAVAGLDLTSIVSLEVTFGAVWSDNVANWTIEDIFTGGYYYHTENGTAPQTESTALEYAYNFTEGLTESEAKTLIIPALASENTSIAHLGGSEAWDASTAPFLGSRLLIDVPVADSPFTSSATIHLYRKVEGQWYELATGDNDVPLTYVDTLTDEMVLADTIAYPPVDLTFDGTQVEAAGVTGVLCGCAWKGSNVFSKSDGKIYFSRTNSFSEVLWDNVVLTNDPGSSDLGPPRTSTLADDTVSPAILMLPAENLYCFTETEGYVFVSGDTAYNASFPRKIDGVRGALGARAGCVFGDRVVVGCVDGLWAIKKSTDFGEQPDELSELTSTVRASWQWLLGEAREQVVVRQILGEIWCFCEERALHRTRTGRWIANEWASGASVKDAVSVPDRGLVMQMDDGALGLIGPYKTDGGPDLAGDEGEDVVWTYTTGFVEAASTVNRVNGFYESDEVEAGVTVALNGSSDSSSVTLTEAGDKAFDKSFDRFKSDRFSITISGKARDVVTRVAVQTTPRVVTRGQG